MPWFRAHSGLGCLGLRGVANPTPLPCFLGMKLQNRPNFCTGAAAMLKRDHRSNFISSLSWLPSWRRIKEIAFPLQLRGNNRWGHGKHRSQKIPNSKSHSSTKAAKPLCSLPAVRGAGDRIPPLRNDSMFVKWFEDEKCSLQSWSLQGDAEQQIHLWNTAARALHRSQAAGHYSEGAQWQQLKYHVQSQPQHSCGSAIRKGLGDGEFQDEAQAAPQGAMTTDVICINVLAASTRMMDHGWEHGQRQHSPFWRAPLTSYSNRAVWQKPGTPAVMIYFNQISCLCKEAIASLHHRYKRYANVDFISCSSPAPLVRFRLGRMTTVIIKWDEGNTERQFLGFWVEKDDGENLCVSPGGSGREAAFGCPLTQQVKELKSRI